MQQKPLQFCGTQQTSIHRFFRISVACLISGKYEGTILWHLIWVCILSINTVDSLTLSDSPLNKLAIKKQYKRVYSVSDLDMPGALILKQTSLPVGTCFANLTLAKFPFPMVFMSLYFPMCGSSVLVLEDEILVFDLSSFCNGGNEGNETHLNYSQWNLRITFKLHIPY